MFVLFDSLWAIRLGERLEEREGCVSLCGCAAALLVGFFCPVAVCWRGGVDVIGILAGVRVDLSHVHLVVAAFREHDGGEASLCSGHPFVAAQVARLESGG